MPATDKSLVLYPSRPPVNVLLAKLWTLVELDKSGMSDVSLPLELNVCRMPIALPKPW